MRVREPNDRERAALEQAAQAGVVLDYILLVTGDDFEPSLLHQDAASTCVEVASRRRGFDPEIRGTNMAGRRVAVGDFYGWHFDRSTRRLRVPAGPGVFAAWQELYRTQAGVKASLSSELGYGPYQWADDDNPDHAIWVRGEITCTYAHAFCDPPYPVRVPRDELQRIFLDIDDAVLGTPGPDSEIWWWDGGDWADYFAPGLDWWGAWVATVRTSPTNFVAIGASSSD